VGPFTKQIVKVNGPHGGRGRVCETDMACVRVGQGMAGQNHHMDTPNILKFGHYLPTCLGRWNTQCSETSAYKIQTPGNYPEENIQHIEHGENLKLRYYVFFFLILVGSISLCYII
jgi:hypothetical protein